MADISGTSCTFCRHHFDASRALVVVFELFRNIGVYLLLLFSFFGGVVVFFGNGLCDIKFFRKNAIQAAHLLKLKFGLECVGSIGLCLI